MNSDEYIMHLESSVTRQGTSAKADVPGRYLGKRV
jgi:putative transposon-encoded protein